MKMLILSLLLTPVFNAHSQEIVESGDSKQIVSVVKDIEVEDLLTKTSEFRKCRDENAFTAGASESVRTANLKKAEDCFKKELNKSNDPKKLEQLSEALKLQQYGLVKSKNVKDIQAYLNSKMYKSLTGVNPDEKDKKALAESMKFKNKKNIDQSLFITLYKNQLNKNALFEISRFCFENLRSTKPAAQSKRNFGEHWFSFTGPNSLTLNDVTDDGIPQFGTLSDPSDKDKIYQDIFASIKVGGPGGFHTGLLDSFFQECGAMIVPLCDEFKKKAGLNLTNIESKVDADKNSPQSKGAAACLTKSRIQEIKKALIDTDKVIAEFDKMKDGAALERVIQAGMKGEPIKLYQNGTGAGEETLDNLTNYTSSDIIDGGYLKDEGADKEAEDCQKRPELSSCEKYISQGDTLDKVKHNVEMEMTLKREVELARVRELNKRADKTKFEDYLRENGYFSILEDYQKNGMSDQELERRLGEEFEAKKIATLMEINNKLGKRQVSKDATDADIAKNANEVITETKEERARLAQVVLFNNIITSYLELSRSDGKGGSEKVGRNFNAWKKEEGALKSGQVDESLFANLKTGDDSSKGIGANEQIGGIEFLDSFLGKQP